MNQNSSFWGGGGSRWRIVYSTSKKKSCGYGCEVFFIFLLDIHLVNSIVSITIIIPTPFPIIIHRPRPSTTQKKLLIYNIPSPLYPLAHSRGRGKQKFHCGPLLCGQVSLAPYSSITRQRAGMLFVYVVRGFWCCCYWLRRAGLGWVVAHEWSLGPAPYINSWDVVCFAIGGD